ncbi:hypothetical protein [Archangium lansingense]|uniref:Secreted protein n=1 Tax=Archangium lansingense TaxID=2995310 RepID=A0ABT4AC70_9BACT|nr:hypothetical protein [Archangium lansinium]MCY1079257.1 hypothetical protein [Archangium lansinium]
MRMFFMLMLAVGMGCASHAVSDADEEDTPSPAPVDASTEDPTTCDDSYIACGCGCCGGVPAREESCLPCDGGKALQDIIAADKAHAQDPNCAFAGCSIPVRYTYCDTPSTGP